MPAKVHTSKVLCYIVRDGQLLVFRHADYDPEHVGIQVPAGSIRHGESPEAAALREARGNRPQPVQHRCVPDRPVNAGTQVTRGQPGALRKPTF